MRPPGAQLVPLSSRMGCWCLWGPSSPTCIPPCILAEVRTGRSPLCRCLPEPRWADDGGAVGARIVLPLPTSKPGSLSLARGSLKLFVWSPGRMLCVQEDALRPETRMAVATLSWAPRTLHSGDPACRLSQPRRPGNVARHGNRDVADVGRVKD